MDKRLSEKSAKVNAGRSKLEMHGKGEEIGEREKTKRKQDYEASEKGCLVFGLIQALSPTTSFIVLFFTFISALQDVELSDYLPASLYFSMLDYSLCV